MPDFRKVISMGGLWELPPPTLQRSASGTWFEAFVRFVLRPLWGWRLELGAAAAVLWLVHAGSLRIGEVATGAALGGVVGGCMAWASLRQRVGRVFGRARLRRQWRLAVRHAGLATLNDRIPWPVRIQDVPVGERMRVRIPAGSSVGDLEDEAEIIAAFLRVGEVRVEREGGDAGRAVVTIVRRDTLSGRDPIPWPRLGAERLSFTDPIPLGVDEAGEQVDVSMLGRNMVVGGE